MKNIVHTTEHELKEGLDETNIEGWVQKYSDIASNTQAIILYSAEEPEVGHELLKVAKELPFNGKKLLIFGECQEKGGGGDGITVYPTLIQLISYYIIFTISSSIAKTFLEEFTKDLYKNTFGKFFATRRKTKLNKTILFKLEGQYRTLSYILHESLSDDECTEAMFKISNHYNENVNEETGDGIFIYSKANKGWEAL